MARRAVKLSTAAAWRAATRLGWEGSHGPHGREAGHETLALSHPDLVRMAGLAGVVDRVVIVREHVRPRLAHDAMLVVKLECIGRQSLPSRRCETTAYTTVAGR